MAIRKSVTELTPEEKIKFITGVKRLKTTPPPPPTPPIADLTATNMYDWFVEVHDRSMTFLTPPDDPTGRNAAHQGPAFLPWHREFILRFERQLQIAVGDDNFGLPYWDWAADAALPDPTDPNQAVIWRNDFMGGQGTPVRTGHFREGEWTLFPSGSLARELGRSEGVSTLPTQAHANAAVAATTYDSSPWNRLSATGFRNQFEGWLPANGLHNRIHLWVGGSMLPGTSPNDPVFFLHHCNVDRIWALWQQCHPGVPYRPTDADADAPAGHRLNDRMFPWTSPSDRRIADLLDFTALGYTYDSFHRRFIRLRRTTGDRFISSQIIEVSDHCDTRDDIATRVFIPAAAGGSIRARYERTRPGASPGDVTTIETATDVLTVES